MYARPKGKSNVATDSDSIAAQPKGVSMPAVPVLQQATLQKNAIEDEAVQGKFETAQLVEEEEPLQGKFAPAQLVEDEEPLQGKFAPAQMVEDEEPLQGKFGTQPTAQLEEKSNNTGLPDSLKAGVESLSGMSMDHVKVHYNSDRPAQLNAHAYAQGSDIHVASGQEKHLPHEAWHVVQQAQGRVKPTMQMKGNVPVNDDQGLEHEADAMGNNANTAVAQPKELKPGSKSVNIPVAQLAGTKPNQPSVDGRYRIKLSSVRESFVYGNAARFGLDAVLPGSHTVTVRGRLPNGKMGGVKIEGSDEWIRLKEPIDMPTADQKVLCIDTVAWEDEAPKIAQGGRADQKCVLDVKIGTYTKSTEQFDLEGAGFFKRQLKKLEHNLKDLNRDSRGLGYDIDAGNLSDFLKLAQAPASSTQLRAALRNLRPKVATLRDTMAAAPITFVGSSLFLVFNITDPTKSEVKLIDPDHPIVVERPEGMAEEDLPDQLVRPRHFEGQSRTWEQYVQKWQGGFVTGMVNFLRWMDDLL